MVITKIAVAAAAAAGLAGYFAPAPLAESDTASPTQQRPAQDRPIIDLERLGHAFK